MSIFTRAKVLLLSSLAAYVVAASALTVVTPTTATADWLRIDSCVGGWGSFSCIRREGPAGDPYVRTVPQPDNEADKELAAARDRKWIDRCHPTIGQDRYGVPRYHYAAGGCEFGVIE